MEHCWTKSQPPVRFLQNGRVSTSGQASNNSTKAVKNAYLLLKPNVTRAGRGMSGFQLILPLPLESDPTTS